MDILGQLLLGWFAADLLGGLFHVFVDHYASPTCPLTRAVVKDFHEHHDDRLSMLKYSRVPSLILGLLGILPFVLLAYCLGYPWLAGSLFAGGLLTQHAHYYSHVPDRPWWASLLQQLGVWASPAAHERHHSDFFQSYGVLNGWSHGVLDLVLGRRY